MKGIGIGNGLTNPIIQYQYAAKFAYDNTYGIKAVTKDQYYDMLKTTKECVEKIERCNLSDKNDNELCVDAFMFCQVNLQIPYILSGRNIYDIRQPTPPY